MPHHTSPPVLANEDVFAALDGLKHAPVGTKVHVGTIVEPGYLGAAKEMALLRHDLEVWAVCARMWRGVALAVTAALLVAVLYIWLK